MGKLFDFEEVGTHQVADIQDGDVWIHDNALFQDIKLDAKAALKLLDFLTLHQEHLKKHAQQESEG